MTEFTRVSRPKGVLIREITIGAHEGIRELGLQHAGTNTAPDASGGVITTVRRPRRGGVITTVYCPCESVRARVWKSVGSPAQVLTIATSPVARAGLPGSEPVWPAIVSDEPRVSVLTAEADAVVEKIAVAHMSASPNRTAL